MLLLKLRPAPTGPAPAPDSGTGTVRLARTALRASGFRTLKLGRGQFVPSSEGEDYDALMVGPDNLLVGNDRILAVP